MSAVEPNREPAPDEYPTLKVPSFDGEDPTLQEAALQETPAPAERPRRSGALNHADPVSIGIGMVFFLIGGLLRSRRGDGPDRR